jgi:hypothetical protein
MMNARMVVALFGGYGDIFGWNNNDYSEIYSDDCSTVY